jgi:hypothetical protein
MAVVHATHPKLFAQPRRVVMDPIDRCDDGSRHRRRARLLKSARDKVAAVAAHLIEWDEQAQQAGFVAQIVIE